METKRPFIDEIFITIASGNGGEGAVSFSRETSRKHGAPDGGNGGRGGNVIFQVHKNLKTLSHLYRNKTYKAENGANGSANNRNGRSGKDLIISVPPGTLVKHSTTKETIVDLNNNTLEYTVLSGGKGGKGNAFFASSRRRSPRFSQPGMLGVERNILLELSIIADIGLIGYPNAGKSTLLSVLSNARPKIANYPFTTKTPNIGVMYVHGQEIILADIPGLIQGASQGAGLGFRFLKHISRTSVLAYLIDISDNQNPALTFTSIRSELYNYDPQLMERKYCVIASKIDQIESDKRVQVLTKQLSQEIKTEVIPISSITQQGIQYLAQQIFEMYRLNAFC